MKILNNLIVDKDSVDIAALSISRRQIILILELLLFFFIKTTSYLFQFFSTLSNSVEFLPNNLMKLYNFINTFKANRRMIDLIGHNKNNLLENLQDSCGLRKGITWIYKNYSCILRKKPINKVLNIISIKKLINYLFTTYQKSYGFN